jgi:L-galactose dehydrogenase
VYGITSPNERQRAVDAAIDLGINFFDVSPYYGTGLAEERLGQLLGPKRDRVVLATKCGRLGIDQFDFSAAGVRRSVEASLLRLRTDYVDLLQVHDIEFGDSNQIVEETIPTLRELQQEGKARHIGITGLQLGVLQSVAEQASVDTILSYCRFNLLNQDMDHSLTPFTRENDIGLINASPLHMGILTESGPPAWHPAAEEVKQAGAAIVQLCAKAGVRVTDVALQYCVQHPYVSSTFVGQASLEEVERNVGAISQPVASELLADIQAISSGVRGSVWASGRQKNRDPSLDGSPGLIPTSR